MVIKTEALTKKFGKLTAVNELNLEVNEGEIFGLPGPNGAGKTTLKPTSGKAWVNGFDVLKEPGKVRKSIGIVFQQPSVAPERLGMGTTLVAALLDGEGRGLIANIGDSRAYLIGNNITRITKDHSYVQELVEKGIIAREEAAVHLQKNIVTKIIGMEDAEPDFFEIELGKNTLLLCSDGLTDALSDEEIREVVISSKIENVCKNLVEAAKPLTRDNITVVAAKR